MKKLVICFMLMLSAAFVSCGNSSSTPEVTETDSITIDSLVNDTIVTDSDSIIIDVCDIDDFCED